VGVNHIEGHLAAILGERTWEPPYLALVVSGGHTELLQVDGSHNGESVSGGLQGPGRSERGAQSRIRLLGATRDDAAGEAFDKVAKLLGLGFPGGPVLDRLAHSGDPSAFAFPRAMLGLEKRGGVPPAEPARTAFLQDLAASFQEAVVDVLIAKIEAASARTGIRQVLLAGGVACNSRLRARASELAERIGGEAAYARPALCADNAAMIGLAALPRLLAGESDPLELPAVANLDDLW
jgi:N6-L-threonylcarbamoyladenine synthase